MRFTGQGPKGFPGMQGPGGMAPPMNSMQKQGMQGPPQGQPMPQGPPQQIAPQRSQAAEDSMQFMQAGADNRSGLANRLAAARDALQRARIMGADPMTMQQLQSDLAALEQSASMQMMQQQQQMNSQMARGPGVGRSPNPYGPGWQTANRNNALDMQMLAQLFGLGGGGPGPNRS